jgi:hypothetical protein
MPPIRFRIRTIMIVVAAVALSVTIRRGLMNPERRFTAIVVTLFSLAALITILMAAVDVSIKLLVSLIGYVLRPITKSSARPSQGSDRPEAGRPNECRLEWDGKQSTDAAITTSPNMTEAESKPPTSGPVGRAC